MIKAVDNTLDAKTVVKRKPKTRSIQSKELFIQCIRDLELAFTRQAIMYQEFHMDNTLYDELFFTIIDKLMVLKFGKEISDLISFYIYNRYNPDGTVNKLLDADGKQVILNTPEELWDLIIFANPNLENP